MPVRSNDVSSDESGALFLYGPGVYRPSILRRDLEDSLMLVRDFHEQVARAQNSGDESGAINFGQIFEIGKHIVSALVSRDEYSARDLDVATRDVLGSLVARAYYESLSAR